MYEFLVAWNRDYEDADALAARMCICSMISRDRLDPPENRTWLQEHWAKLAVKNSKYRDNYINNLAPGTSATIDNISEIHGRVDKMVDFIVDRLQYQTPEAMLDVVKTRLKLDADKRRQRAEVFAKLVEEINRRLGRRKSISELLTSKMPRFFADSKVIPEAVGQISGDKDSLVASLADFEDVLQRGDSPASRDERKDLMEVLGGLVLLTVDPDWVLRHRAAKLAEPIPIPGSDSVMALGEDEAGGKIEVSLLHLSTVALADNVARIKSLFCRESLPRQLTSMPVVGESYGTVSRSDEIKRVLIQRVCHRDIPVPTESVGEKRDQFEEAFDQARRVIRIAATRERSPWWAADKKWVDAAAELEFLGVTGLLLFSERSTSTEKFLINHVEKLLSLHRIWQFLDGAAD